MRIVMYVLIYLNQVKARQHSPTQNLINFYKHISTHENKDKEWFYH